eukprot:jgi/Orpsp1_1/1185096/evm.model.c7180000092267.2
MVVGFINFKANILKKNIKLKHGYKNHFSLIQDNVPLKNWNYHKNIGKECFGENIKINSKNKHLIVYALLDTDMSYLHLGVTKPDKNIEIKNEKAVILFFYYIENNINILKNWKFQFLLAIGEFTIVKELGNLFPQNRKVKLMYEEFMNQVPSTPVIENKKDDEIIRKRKRWDEVENEWEKTLNKRSLEFEPQEPNLIPESPEINNKRKRKGKEEEDLLFNEIKGVDINLDQPSSSRNTFYSTIDPEPYDPPRLIHHKIPSFGILYAGQGPIDYKTHRKYQRLQFKCKVPSISPFWQKFLGVQFMSGDKVVMEFVPWGFEMVNIDIENPTHPIEIAKGVKTTTDTLAVRPPFWIESRVVTEDEDFIINPEEYGFEMVQVQEINRE